MTAGQKLRANLDAPLRHASAEPGRELEFDEAELVRKPEPRPTALVSCSPRSGRARSRSSNSPRA